MKKQVTLALIVAFNAFFPAASLAQPWTPSSNELILKYAPAENSKVEKDNLQDTLAQIDEYLALSNIIGNSFYADKAEILLQKINAEAFELNPQQENDLHYFSAVIAQKNHHFKKALELLDQIDQNSARFSSAQLLAARILTIAPAFKDNALKAATTKCQSVMTVLGPETSLLCILDARLSQPEITEPELKNLTRQLLQLRFQNYTDVSEMQNSAIEQDLYLWYNRLLSIAYHKNNQDQKALDTISNNITQSLANTQEYDLLFWIDLQLDTDTPQADLNKVYRFLQQKPEDQLELQILQRLARIETALQLDNQYASQAKELISLKQQRQDENHPFLYAYHYLYISPDVQQALFWSQKNLKQSKDYADFLLLQQAQLAVSNNRATSENKSPNK